MVERIRNLLDTRQLTPTQFADLIGVARPIVSHILSGRNKPSLEVVQRILAALPDLSMPWLLNGTGPMYSAATAAPLATADQQHTGVAQATEAVPESRTVPPSAAAAPPSVAVPPRVTQADASLPAQKTAKRVVSNGPALRRFTPKAAEPQPASSTPVAPAAETSASVPTQPLPTTEVVALPTADNGAALPANGTSIATALFAGAEKPIRRIVIFYRDGSFADYQPE